MPSPASSASRTWSRYASWRFVSLRTRPRRTSWSSSSPGTPTSSGTPPSGSWLRSLARPGTDGVLRRAARMALRVHADLQVVHVVGDESSRPASKQALAAIKQLAEDLGATWHEVIADDPAPALVKFAKENQITQIVLGASRRSRWERVVSRASVVQRVLRFAGQSGVDVHVIARYGDHHGPAGASADSLRTKATEAELSTAAKALAAARKMEPGPISVDELSQPRDE